MSRPPVRNPRTSGSSGQDAARRRRGIWGRASRSDRREEIQDQRYRPYRYQSNSRTVAYLGATLAVWIALCLLLAWQDNANASLYEDWVSQGLTVIPPAGIAPDELLAYAAAEGFDCQSLENLVAGVGECERVWDIRKGFSDSQDNANLLFAGLIAATIVVAFPFSTFTNRASRNLLPLKSVGQKISPEWAVLWFFIPVMNAVRPVQVFRELFKGSDPKVGTDNPREWLRMGRVPLILYAWWPLFLASLFFNPVFVPRVWSGTRDDISDLVATSSMLVWADLLLATMGVAAFLMISRLHSLQEARRAKVGDILATRPRPGDPMSSILSEGDNEVRETNQGENR